MTGPPQTDDVVGPTLGLNEGEFEGIDDLSVAVFRAFIQAVRLHGKLMVRTMREHGAHPGQAICLRALAVRDDTTQRDLAEALHLAKPTVSRMLRDMQEAGLVERAADADDQRLTRVRLTPKGRTLAAELQAVAAIYVRETIGSLPPDDRAELARLLDKLSDSISRAIKDRPETAAQAEAPGDDDS